MIIMPKHSNRAFRTPPTAKPKRIYLISTWHGEGQTLYYLNAVSRTDEADWRVIRSFKNRRSAEIVARLMNLED